MKGYTIEYSLKSSAYEKDEHMKEITYEEMRSLPEGSYALIDIRDEGRVAYGTIPGAINIFADDLEDSGELARIPADKKLIFFCEIGRRSR